MINLLKHNLLFAISDSIANQQLTCLWHKWFTFILSSSSCTSA